MLASIPVVVSGATGRLGREIVRTVLTQVGMELVGAIGHARHLGEDIGELITGDPCGVEVSIDIDSSLGKARGGVLVDVSTGSFIREVVSRAIKQNIACVVGTTGISNFDFEEISSLVKEYNVPVLFVPNFALGAVLMIKFAKMASKYFKWAEIVESHHERKVDSPSGTALYTAEVMARASNGKFRSPVESDETVKGVRGGKFGGIRIHSVRLPGYVADQQVIFGGQGETLTLHHSSSSRESFMSGVILAIRKIRELEGLNTGLENLLD